MEKEPKLARRLLYRTAGGDRWHRWHQHEMSAAKQLFVSILHTHAQ